MVPIIFTLNLTVPTSFTWSRTLRRAAGGKKRPPTKRGHPTLGARQSVRPPGKRENVQFEKVRRHPRKTEKLPHTIKPGAL
jgi:hypothetical protein